MSFSFSFFLSMMPLPDKAPAMIQPIRRGKVRLLPARRTADSRHTAAILLMSMLPDTPGR